MIDKDDDQAIKTIKVIEREWTGPVVEVEVEYTDEDIEGLFGDDPNCLVMALLRRAQDAEAKLENIKSILAKLKDIQLDFENEEM